MIKYVDYLEPSLNCKEKELIFKNCDYFFYQRPSILFNHSDKITDLFHQDLYITAHPNSIKKWNHSLSKIYPNFDPSLSYENARIMPKFNTSKEKNKSNIENYNRDKFRTEIDLKFKNYHKNFEFKNNVLLSFKEKNANLDHKKILIKDNQNYRGETFEFPAVTVNIKSKLDKNKKIKYKDIVKFTSKLNVSIVKLPDKLLENLDLETNNQNMVKKLYFHTSSYAFTPYFNTNF